MSHPPFRRALVSVSDKTGLVDFLKPLVEQGLSIVSTGGTAKTLKDAGYPVMEVQELTGFPEVMDGRVKTLHPRIHMALLARSNKPEDLELLKKENLEPFDLVIVNLYPFENALKKSSSLQDQVEMIDIGGPTLLRAAAKSFERLTVVCDPSDYQPLLEKKETTLEDRRRLAAKVFAHVSAYDSMVAGYLNPQPGSDYSLGGHLVQKLRYGENPHQQGIWYRRAGAPNGWHQARILQGKELSYNNLLDLEAARLALVEFDRPCFVGIKHNNPCGVAMDENLSAAVERGLKADPVSIFGGIVAVNRALDESCAKALTGLFLECVVAPEITDGAMEIFKKKKNLRVLVWPELARKSREWKVQSLSGGFLLQEADEISSWSEDWKCLSEIRPPRSVQLDLEMAWKVSGALKSNAIAIIENDQTLGLGMGQVNRVDAVEQAIERMHKFHQPKTPVLASDAFFPFADSLERIAQAGIRWVIQPGGSINDKDVFTKAEELGVHMILTGRRHFRH